MFDSKPDSSYSAECNILEMEEIIFDLSEKKTLSLLRSELLIRYYWERGVVSH